MQVKNWVYQLQDLDPVAMGKVTADVKVVDAQKFSASGMMVPYLHAEVEQMRNRGAVGGIWNNTTPDLGRVIAYTSIGEAETYRRYWQKSWKTSPPGWLDKENPEWQGNYKVKFWSAFWQDIVLSNILEIVASGFDGAYLDIIDAYEYWDERGVPEADRLMVGFVKKISHHAKARNPAFWIIPQNGSGLLWHADYRAAIDGIGQEDLYWNAETEGRRSPDILTSTIERNLDLLTAEKKAVMCVEYTPKDVPVTLSWMLKKGYAPYIAERSLSKLTPPIKIVSM